MSFKSLLSIDLDYFGNSAFPFYNKHVARRVEREYEELFSIVSDFKRKGGEVFLVESHDGILDLFDDYKVDKLINIDYHSDTVDENSLSDSNVCNLATWVNFYQYKEECSYEWRYPSFADCVCDAKGLIRGCYEEVFWAKGKKIDNGFKENIRKCGLNNLKFGEIQSIGIATSWETDKPDGTGKFSDIDILEKFINEYSFLFDDKVSLEIIKVLKAKIKESKTIKNEETIWD